MFQPHFTVHCSDANDDVWLRYIHGTRGLYTNTVFVQLILTLALVCRFHNVAAAEQPTDPQWSYFQVKLEIRGYNKTLKHRPKTIVGKARKQRRRHVCAIFKAYYAIFDIGQWTCKTSFFCILLLL